MRVSLPVQTIGEQAIRHYVAGILSWNKGAQVVADASHSNSRFMCIFVNSLKVKMLEEASYSWWLQSLIAVALAC
jgi:hypothetical protein